MPDITDTPSILGSGIVSRQPGQSGQAEWSLHLQDTASSSNDLAAETLARLGKGAEGQCFVVGEQTKGRGRCGRRWISQPGDGLYFSAILCPEIDCLHWPTLSFVASLAVHQTLAGFVGANSDRLRVKWPNDILADGRKIAGILLEASEKGVIVGCGINLKHAPLIEDAALAPIALETLLPDIDIKPSLIAKRLMEVLADDYRQWNEQGGGVMIRRWLNFCDMKGRQIRVQTLSSVREGICTGFGDRGQLFLKPSSGDVIEITAGDVEIMRGQ